MITYDKSDYFYIGIIISGTLLAVLAIVLTTIKPDFYMLGIRFREFDPFKTPREFYMNYQSTKTKYKKALARIEELEKEVNFHKSRNSKLQQEIQGHIQDKFKLSKGYTQAIKGQEAIRSRTKSLLNNDDDELDPNFFNPEEEINKSPTFATPPPPTNPPSSDLSGSSPLRMLFN